MAARAAGTVPAQARGHTLGSRFDGPERGAGTALTAVRLLLALSVLVWHSFPLTGHFLGFGPARRILGDGGVDSFFAISGFLVVGSWQRRRRVADFLRARCARILPGYWLSLVITAAVLAPLGIRLAGARLPPGYAGDAARYVGGNLGLVITDFRIGTTPAGIPFTAGWNASIWTLAWEFGCYLWVAVLGLVIIGGVALLDRRATVPVLCLAALLFDLLGTGSWQILGRFALMFGCGALLHRFRDRVVVRPALVALAFVLLVGSSALPDYRPVGALPLAYLVLAVGSLRLRGLGWRTDLSYGCYLLACPVQQLLACAGLWRLGVAPFAVLATALTLPLAAASWFAVERPALRWGRRRGTAGFVTRE